MPDSRILPEPKLANATLVGCRRCTRLADFRDRVRAEHPGYWCRPVPPFGDPAARLVIVGLAPGMHGANATGRAFTGDHAGLLLYATLHEFGFASQSRALASDDGLALRDCRITNAVKCLPPQNKPLPMEIRTCNRWLAEELQGVPAGAALLALGRIAHDATLLALGLSARGHPFAHAAVHRIETPRPGVALFDSYHCSRYNTNTRKLTESMFRSVFVAIAAHLGQALP